MIFREKQLNLNLVKIMSDKRWKAVEREIAKYFGTRRTPLSGSNAGGTKSDTLHPKLFIETKHRKSFGLWKLYQSIVGKANQEGKLPLVAIKQKGGLGFLLLINPNDVIVLADIIKELEK